MARKKKTTPAPTKPEPLSDSAAARELELEQLSPEETAQVDEAIDASVVGDEVLDRATASRARRLARVGCPSLACAVLGIDLDVGPRAQARALPCPHGDEWISAAAAQILDAGLSAEELDRAAEWLRARDGTS